MVYILSPELADEALETAHARIREIVSASAEEVEAFEDWGRKRLAYEINDLREGNYAVITFSANVDAPREIDRVIKITPNLMRHLIVRLDD